MSRDPISCINEIIIIAEIRFIIIIIYAEINRSPANVLVRGTSYTTLRTGICLDEVPQDRHIAGDQRCAFTDTSTATHLKTWLTSLIAVQRLCRFGVM